MKHVTFIATWFSWTLGRWPIILLVSMVLGGVLASAAYASGPKAMNFTGKLTLQDGKLAARIVAAPLQQVIEEVSRLSGARVLWLSQDMERTVSVEFPALPFAEALRRIVGEKNFMLFYTSVGVGTKLTQIWISSRGKAGEQPVFVLQPISAVNASSLSANDQAVQGKETLGQGELDSMPLDIALQTALSDGDSSSRLRAIAHLGQYAQEDSRIAAVLSDLARSDANSQVQEAASEVLAGME